MGDTCDGSLIFVPYASGQVLTFDETHNDFSICVQAMDLYGNATYVTSAYPIAVTPNLPPTSLHLSPSIVNENTAVATTIIATDPDPSDTFGYSFCVSGADNTLFALSGDQLISSIILDYENPQDTDMNNVYDVCIEVMDSVGNIYQQILSLSVRDVSESISG
ncbi:MAG: hypothetical protein H6766_01465 [Candidatus Peribacteria bacterium]|nr:MAG: hypothetical protein H6766_01465 [Candidatus Peribacteria bacterium]